MPKEEHEVAIQLTERRAEQHFANMVAVSHTPHNFSLDCIQIAPQGEILAGLVVARVALPPAVAKALLKALAKQVDKYESRYGVIAPHTMLATEGDDNE